MAFTDPKSRIERLIAQSEPRIATAFLDLVGRVQSNISLEEIADFLAIGNFEAALGNLLVSSGVLAEAWNTVFVTSGQSTAVVVDRALASFGFPRIPVSFNQVNERAVDEMRRNSLRLVSGFTQGQREASRRAMLEGIRRGANPREMARAFKGSIGLTVNQVSAVANYRDALESNTLDSLNRELRDRRFDSTVRRAAQSGQPLTTAQIDRMVERYRERMIQNRAETIARTEALDAVHAGVQQMYSQAIEEGLLAADQIRQTWNTSGGSRVRATHRPMNGQVRQIGDRFTSGGGRTSLRPGGFGVGSEDIQCRCILGIRILSFAEVETTV